MTYQEFNKNIWAYYLSKSSSTFFTLAIDKYEFQKILLIDQIKAFGNLQSSWDDLLEIKNSIPQYFGLIAIQCLAASSMQEDQENSAEAYQIRLCELLQLDSSIQLQALFRGKAKTCIQEQIWHSAKKYLEITANLQLRIPDKKFSVGRYVQYPKSQALLNTQDLKAFTIFFTEEKFQPLEVIPFDYFYSRLVKCIRYMDLTRRAIKLLQDDLKQDACIKQVYDTFNNWDGEIITLDTNPKGKNKYEGKKATLLKKLILVNDTNKPQFILIDKSTNELNEISDTEVFKISGYTYKYHGLVIFNETYYSNEYEESRFLYPDNTCFILVDKSEKKIVYNYLEKFSSLIYEFSDDLLLYKYSFNIEDQYSALKSLIYLKRPVTLIGGIKLDRKNNYLKNWGPSIDYVGEYEIIFNHTKINYETNNLIPGLYKVRTENFKDVEFNIVEINSPSRPLLKKDKGWNLKKYSLDKNFDIQGCYIIKTNYNNHILRNWIEIQSYQGKRKYKGDNIILKALQNSLY